MRYYLLLVGFMLFVFPSAIHAGDVSIAQTDITFSSPRPFAGNRLRIYAKISNTSQTDTRVFVQFTADNKQIGQLQPTTVIAFSNSTVFVDWIPDAGYYTLSIAVIQPDPIDGDLSNNTVTMSDFLVDMDTDDDLVGNKDDLDDDNDGIDDGVEGVQGTNPLLPDTDGDGSIDSVDEFPLDSNEQHDNDKDGIGNNADTDDDNDGTSDINDSAPFNPLIPEKSAAPVPAKAVEPVAPEPPVAQPVQPDKDLPKEALQIEPVEYTFPDESEKKYDITVQIAQSRVDWNTWSFEALGAGEFDVYLWNFGDGTTGHAEQETHTFKGIGPYTITLSASDGAGGMGAVQTDISIGFWHLGNPWIIGLVGILGIIAIVLIAMLIFEIPLPFNFI